MDQTFRHFYRKSYQDRLAVVGQFAALTSQMLQTITQHTSATNANLIENYLTDYALPEGIGVNLVVNGQAHAVPMVTEEPSVIAAVSNGARLLQAHGIAARVIDRKLIGQVILHQPGAALLEWIATQHAELIATADAAHPTLKGYGGGASDVAVRKLDDENYSLDLTVDVAESMGANIMNSMLEQVGSIIDQRQPGVVLMQILSNYATASLVEVTGQIDVQALKTPNMDGAQLAERIALASHIAQVDPYRATTHNKGIMNGVDAVVMAMGNDWRAIESGAHAYAARDGQYRGLSEWHVSNGQLVGKLTLPLPVGFVGGATKVLPMVAINQRIAKVQNARELMQLIAATGLAQNLAALRAIVSEGIQKGHMGLQIKSLAISAGAAPEEVGPVVAQLKKIPNANQADAKRIIEKIRGG